MNINTNNPGSVAAAVWANATRSLTNPGGSVLGSALQSPVNQSGISLIATGTTVVLNFSGAAGVLLAFGYVIGTTISAGAPSDQIEIVADGVTSIIPIHVTGQSFNPPTKALANFNSGSGGGSAGDTLNFQWPIQFTNSLIVRLNVTVAASTAGTATISVMYAHN